MPLGTISDVFLNIVQRGGGGGVKPMFKKFCCKFGIILEAIWQYKIDLNMHFVGKIGAI